MLVYNVRMLSAVRTQRLLTQPSGNVALEIYEALRIVLKPKTHRLESLSGYYNSTLKPVAFHLCCHFGFYIEVLTFGTSSLERLNICSILLTLSFSFSIS
jgi:hypothetical protein